MTGALNFDIGIATLSVYDHDDFPGVQIDPLGDGGIQDYEVHSTYGFLAKPLDPATDGAGNPTQGCTVLYALEGGKGHAWLCSDPRVTPLLPALRPGESLMYAAGGQFIRLHATDGDTPGAITLFTSDDGTVNGQNVYLQVARDALRFVAPWGTITFDASGFHLVTDSGARLDLGAIGGVPLIGSYASLSAGMVDISGSVVAAGADGPAQPLTYATPLIQILAQLITVVSAINATTTGAPAAALTALLPTVIAAATSS
jgi:hypothetical protein